MKILVLLSLLACAVTSSEFHDSSSEEVSPSNVCAGVPNGTRLPVPGDCNRFILCDNNAAMTLSCRATEPHFNRCTQQCVNNANVCFMASCPGETAPPTLPPPTTPMQTPPPTLPPTQPPTLPPTPPPTLPPTPPPTLPPTPPPTLPPTPAPTFFPPTAPPVTQAPTTTTTFIPPTAPPNIPCLPIDFNPPEDPCGWHNGTACECDQQWGCWRGQCGCDWNRQCPFDDFDGRTCTLNCGCQANCNCESPGFNCICNSMCRCFDTAVCPFVPAQCIQRCGCQRRCNCSGQFCTCDPNLGC